MYITLILEHACPVWAHKYLIVLEKMHWLFSQIRHLDYAGPNSALSSVYCWGVGDFQPYCNTFAPSLLWVSTHRLEVFLHCGMPQFSLTSLLFIPLERGLKFEGLAGQVLAWKQYNIPKPSEPSAFDDSG